MLSNVHSLRIAGLGFTIENIRSSCKTYKTEIRNLSLTVKHRSLD